MTFALSELLSQKDALERQIKAAQAEARANAISEIRNLMARHGLTVADLAPATRPKSGDPVKKVAPKYRDPESGATWSGRGLRPKWLVAALKRGQSLSEFSI